MTTVKEDAFNWAKTFDITGIIKAEDRQLHRDLNQRCNCPYIASDDLEGIIEIQTLDPGDRTGGTFIINMVAPANGSPIAPVLSPTTDLDWDIDATAMQTAIDIAAPGTWPDYEAGDIVISGGPCGASGADMTFTFSGRSVHGRNLLASQDNTNLTGGTSDPDLSRATEGRHARFWFAALKQMGVISGTDPSFSDTPAGQYTVTLRGELENWPRNETIRKLVKEASVQEFEDWETEILVPLNIPF